MTSRIRLIDALAVVGVISVGLLVGGMLVEQGRDRPKAAACAANLKHLFTALETYAADHTNYPGAARDGKPFPDDWIHWQATRRLTDSALAPYLPGLDRPRLVCPADLGQRYRDYQFSYTLNAHVERLAPSNLLNKAALVLFYEEDAPNDGACAPGERADRLTGRHRRKSNAAFGDGSVGLVREARAIEPEHVRPRVRVHPPAK